MRYLNLLRSVGVVAAIALAFLAGCKSDNTPTNATGGGTLNGTLAYGGILTLATYNIGTQTETDVIPNGQDPSFMNDGEILYSITPSNLNYTTQINKTTLDGGTVSTLITLHPTISDYTRPHASPDGKYIALNYNDDYSSPEYGNFQGTIIFDAGSGTALFSLDSVWDGSWAPDGRLIVAGTTWSLHSTGDITLLVSGLFVYSKDFTTVSQIGANLNLATPEYPAVSPDGKIVAFTMNGHIWKVNMDGTGLTQITTGDKTESHPAWSPDGKWLAFNSEGTFESGVSGTAIGYAASNTAAPVQMTNSAPNWFVAPNNNNTLAGHRLNGYGDISWK